MTDGDAAGALRQLYERYPYPGDDLDGAPLFDAAAIVGTIFPGATLSGWRVLDAGCGSGQRLIGLARSYPAARFMGVDFAERPLAAARRRVERDRLANVEVRHASIMALDLPERFDLITSTGVIHHLADPVAGAQRLLSHLAEDGVLLLWLYHRYGEFERLLHRDLVCALMDADDPADGARVIDVLGRHLSADRYGVAGSRAPLTPEAQRVLDADAFLNPLVTTYTIAEAGAMLGAAGAEWVAINGVCSEGSARLIDLDAPDSVWLPAPALQDRYRSLAAHDRARIVELATRPTGFSIIAGRGTSYRHCDERLARNRIV